MSVTRGTVQAPFVSLSSWVPLGWWDGRRDAGDGELSEVVIIVVGGVGNGGNGGVGGVEVEVSWCL